MVKINALSHCYKFHLFYNSKQKILEAYKPMFGKRWWNSQEK